MVWFGNWKQQLTKVLSDNFTGTHLDHDFKVLEGYKIICPVDWREIFCYRPAPLHSHTMAFRTAAGLARRMMSTSAVRSSEMSFTFGGPNAVFYNAASVKQVRTGDIRESSLLSFPLSFRLMFHPSLELLVSSLITSPPLLSSSPALSLCTRRMAPPTSSSCHLDQFPSMRMPPFRFWPRRFTRLTTSTLLPPRILLPRPLPRLPLLLMRWVGIY